MTQKEKIMRRATAVLMALCATLAVSLVSASPAQAHEGYAGDAENHLAASPAMHIAKFSQGGSTCADYRTGTTYTCARYWLPAGKTDSDLSSSFDVDGIMIESSYWVYLYGNWIYVPAYKWWKIGDLEHISCWPGESGPECYMAA